VPAQALILMNDPFIAEQSTLWAKRTIEDGSDQMIKAAAQGATEIETTKDKEQRTDESDDELAQRRIERLYLEAFARKPSEHEMKATTEFLKQQAAEHGQWPWQHSSAAWTDLCHTLYSAKEFLFVE
jgi:hypothetical protein